MEFETIQYEVVGGAARITLNRPDRLNALTLAMVSELHQVFRLIAAAPDTIRAVMITGAGRAFSSGHDLASPRSTGPDDLREPLRDYYNPAYARLRNLGVPTLAVVNGPCVGAGMSLALNCDIVIASESAYFLSAFVNVGLVPDSGTTWLLPSALGQARAAGMMLLGEKLPARQAADWGLIWRCVEDAQLSKEAESLLHKLANGPTRTYGAIKQLLRSAPFTPLPAQMEAEAEAQALVRVTADTQEAKRAFIERRKPVFTGK